MKGWKIAAIAAVIGVGGVAVGYVAMKSIQNNKCFAQFRKLGDVNGDGVINMADIVLIDTATYSTPSSPNWNPNADLNGDGVVDVSDLNIALANFGLTYAKWLASGACGTSLTLNRPSCRGFSPCRSYTVQTSIVPIKEI